MAYKFKYLVLALLLCSGIYAQQYNFMNYSVEDGVAQSQVYSLFQDKRGYLWMGTRGGGLTRFDGKEFKTYTIKDGLINNYIFKIVADSSGNLWIGTNNGLSCFNGISFKNYYPNGKQKQTWVQDLSIDHHGRKWLATNDGVMLCDHSGKFVNVSRKLNIPEQIINCIYVDEQQAVWYGTADGLYCITETGNGFKQVKFGRSKGFYNNSITCIKQDPEGNIWVGTYGDGAYVYNGRQFSRIDLKQELYKQTVLDIYFGEREHVWFATLSKGVAQYSKPQKTFSWLTEQEGLSSNHVRSIVQDNSGNYWFGTSGGGVSYYFGKQFTVYDKNSGLTGNFIYSVFRDHKKRLWIGNSDKGVSIYDSLIFRNYNASGGFENVKVKAIAEDSSGIMYLGTDGQGVYVFDGATFRPLPDLTKKYVRAIVRDLANNIWIATAGAGIYVLPAGKVYSKPLNYTTKDGLLHNRLTGLCVDKMGRVWYATENNGIGVFENGQLLALHITTKDGLPSNAIRCLTEDGNGYLWAGSAGEGIASISLYDQKFKVSRYNHDNGLSSSNIYLMCADKEHAVFCGSESGLDKITLDQNRHIKGVKHYGKGEGFTGIETCQNSVWKDEDGTLWFGTINGLIKYNPANQVKNNHEPVTTITDVKLFYEPISNTPYKQFAGDWNFIRRLVLPYDQNHLTFDFIAINLSNPSAVKYQWKLHGFDKDWSPVSAQHTFSYPNLPWGDYTFMVKACNEDGVWNREPVKISIRIKKPFWATWWFISLIILSLGTGLFIVFKWRLNIVKRKAAEAQQKVQLEKELLELEQKALRLQMNPHFIFNALNSIQSQIGTNNEQSARYYLAKFSRLMRQILDNSRQTTITLEEEISTLENYLLIEKFCNGDRFDYRIITDPSLETDFIKIPPMLLQPFIENAIKHGMKYQSDKRGFIEVKFEERHDWLVCTVTDNGIGRKKAEELNQASKETYHKSTALMVTRERLNLLNMDADVNPLEIIDLYDDKGQASGTQVILRIPLR